MGVKEEKGEKQEPGQPSGVSAPSLEHVVTKHYWSGARGEMGGGGLSAQERRASWRLLIHQRPGKNG